MNTTDQADKAPIQFETLNCGHLWTLEIVENPLADYLNKLLRFTPLTPEEREFVKRESSLPNPVLSPKQVFEAFYIFSDGDEAHAAALDPAKKDFPKKVFLFQSTIPVTEVPAVLDSFNKMVKECLAAQEPVPEKTPLQKLEETRSARKPKRP